jgi:hypothetical protein
MTDRRLATRPPEPHDDETSVQRHRHITYSGLTERRSQRPHSREEAEERYVAARDAWSAAMRTARSGKPADLAALSMAQEAYEAALAENQRWEAGPRVAVPVEPDAATGLNAVVGQELGWRRVHEHELELEQQPKGGLRGFLRRLRGR